MKATRKTTPRARKAHPKRDKIGSLRPGNMDDLAVLASAAAAVSNPATYDREKISAWECW